MAGRRPKPTALKLLTGNPGKRPLNDSEPHFGGSPKCPSWLPKVAKAEWRRVAAELEALDMLRSVDTAALAAYCLAFARWRSAEEIVEREGQIHDEPILDKNGTVVGHKKKRHPATTVAREERAAMIKAAALFGFDPSSRSRLSVAPKGKNPDDDLTRDDEHDPAYVN